MSRVTTGSGTSAIGGGSGYINAIYDDGSAEGVQRIKLTRGDFVRIPFRIVQYQIIGSASSIDNNILYDNPDGTGSGITITSSAGINNGARIDFPFYGRACGIRWRPNLTTPSVATPTQIYAANFTLMVDNVAYPVVGKDQWVVLHGYGTAFHESEFIVEDLQEGLHHASIVVPADPNNYQSRLVDFYGLLLEKRAGYREATPRFRVAGTNVLTNAAAIVTQSNLGAHADAAVRKIIYYNSTATPVTVTMQYAATTFWSKVVPPLDNIEFDPGFPIQLADSAGSGWAHLASANASITAAYIVVGVY